MQSALLIQRFDYATGQILLPPKWRTEISFCALVWDIQAGLSLLGTIEKSDCEFPFFLWLSRLPWPCYLCFQQPIKDQPVHLKVPWLNQWACCHGRLTRGAIDDDLISFRIWSGKGEDRLNEIPSILMKYNYILLINHLRINMSLLGEPHQNLSFHARPQYILSCSDFYKFSHLCPRVNNSVFLYCRERAGAAMTGRITEIPCES